ncbi:hypothetical protein GCM10027047_01780 [Rhodococcus aerolatus]
MRWPFAAGRPTPLPPAPPAVTEDPAAVREARAQAESAAQQTHARWSVVTQVSSELNELHDRNHFGEMLTASMRLKDRETEN